MKIISYNINNFNGSNKTNRPICKEEIKKFILSQEPDVICLQEVRAKDNLIFDGYAEYRNYNAKHWKSSSGVVTYINEKFKGINHKIIEEFEFNALICCITINNTTIINCHAKTDRMGTEYYNALEVTLNNLKQNRLIIIGDLNIYNKENIHNNTNESTNWNIAMKIFGNNLLVDSYKKNADKNDIYTWQNENGIRDRRLDYAYVSNALSTEIDIKHIHNDFLSDHSMLEVILRTDSL